MQRLGSARVSGFDESFAAWARGRGMEVLTEQGAPPLTPLLAKGGTLDPVARGALANGIDGIVGCLSYTGEGGGGYGFPVALAEVPESTAFVPRLFCEDRGRSEDTVHYGFEIRHEALWTESEVLKARYRVTMGPFQDPNWMRQLFAPTFVDWLATRAPERFSFELAYGHLCCNVEGDEPGSAQLDALCEAAAMVARRLREESLE